MDSKNTGCRNADDTAPLHCSISELRHASGTERASYCVRRPQDHLSWDCSLLFDEVMGQDGFGACDIHLGAEVEGSA